MNYNYKTVAIVETNLYEACMYECRDLDYPLTGDSIGMLIEKIHTEDDTLTDTIDIYVLGRHELPETVGDIRGFIYHEPEIILALVNDFNDVQYIGIKKEIKKDQILIDVDRLKSHLTALSWGQAEIKAICQAVEVSEKIEILSANAGMFK